MQVTGVSIQQATDTYAIGVAGAMTGLTLVEGAHAPESGLPVVAAGGRPGGAASAGTGGSSAVLPEGADLPSSQRQLDVAAGAAAAPVGAPELACLKDSTAQAAADSEDQQAAATRAAPACPEAATSSDACRHADVVAAAEVGEPAAGAAAVSDTSAASAAAVQKDTEAAKAAPAGLAEGPTARADAIQPHTLGTEGNDGLDAAAMSPSEPATTAAAAEDEEQSDAAAGAAAEPERASSGAAALPLSESADSAAAAATATGAQGSEDKTVKVEATAGQHVEAGDKQASRKPQDIGEEDEPTKEEDEEKAEEEEREEKKPEGAAAEEEEFDEKDLIDSWPVMLFWAASTGQDEDVRDLLLHRPDDLPTVGQAVSKALVPAADRGHTVVCELLVAAAAALGVADRVVVATDASKRSVLTLAILGGHAGIVTALLQHCPEAQLAADGCMALTAAVARGQVDIIPLLIAHCPQDQLVPKDGTPPLKLAIQLNRAPCIRALLQRLPEAQLSAVNSAGLTALHYAAYMGQAECVTALLEACPDPAALLSLQTEFGETALMLAAARGHAAALEALVEYVSGEAQLGVEDAEGMTALSYAEAQRFEEGVQLLTAKHAAIASSTSS